MITRRLINHYETPTNDCENVLINDGFVYRLAGYWLAAGVGVGGSGDGRTGLIPLIFGRQFGVSLWCPSSQLCGSIV